MSRLPSRGTTAASWTWPTDAGARTSDRGRPAGGRRGGALPAVVLPGHPERGRMMPAPGGPEPIGGVAFSPADASPSRARLGRVAAMLREAEEVAPVVPRRARRDQAAAAVVSLVGW